MTSQNTGRFLAQLRKQRGWTQAELAAKLQVTDKAVSRWETGKGYPDVQSLRNLSALFAVSINELLAGAHIVKALQPDNADALLLQNIERSRKQIILLSLAVFLIAVVALVISLKLFYNGAIAADELNTSPSVLCGGTFYLILDWLRLALLLALCILPCRVLAVSCRD